MTPPMPWTERAACRSEDAEAFFPLGAEDDDGEWQDRASCASSDPEAWFPEKGQPAWEARRVCAGCEVREPCLEYALDHMGYMDVGTFGIWAGTTYPQRKRLLEERREQAA